MNSKIFFIFHNGHPCYISSIYPLVKENNLYYNLYYKLFNIKNNVKLIQVIACDESEENLNTNKTELVEELNYLFKKGFEVNGKYFNVFTQSVFVAIWLQQ